MGKYIDTFTIVTTDANAIVGAIHDRMPVIFTPENQMKWLDPLIGPKDIDQYLLPYTESDLEIYPISTLVNSPKNDIPEILKSVAVK